MLNMMFLAGLSSGIILTWMSGPAFQAIRRVGRRMERRVRARLYRKRNAERAAIRARNHALIMVELEKPVYDD